MTLTAKTSINMIVFILVKKIINKFLPPVTSIETKRKKTSF